MLSEHFSIFEFTRSAKADQLGLLNQPNALQISHMELLCDNVLEPLRKYFGKPVTITSGFRCPELNKAVGGVPTSQHTTGEAADIHIDGVRNDALWNFIVTHLNFDQCIAERVCMGDGSKGWVHVSYSLGHNRSDKLSCPTPGNYMEGLHYAPD